MSFPNLKRAEGHFVGIHDTKLFYQEWLRDSPKGLLIITHGHGEHSDSYQRFIHGVAQSGWAFCSWDLRGHGRSEGKRGFAANFSDYCDDYYLFLKYIYSQTLFKNIPKVVLGHSMGGLIQLKTLIDKGSDFDINAQVLSAPLTGLSVEVPFIKDIAALLAYNIYPKLTLWNELNPTQFTSDPLVLEEYSKDPLRHDQMSPGVYLGFLKAFDLLDKEIEKITIPTLLQLGLKDTAISNESASNFFERLSSKIKKKIIYEQSLHEIYNDIERQKSYADVVEFLKPFSI